MQLQHGQGARVDVGGVQRRQAGRLTLATQDRGLLLPLGLELEHLHLGLGPQDGGLLGPLGLEHGGLLAPPGAVDGGLLLTF